MKTVNNTDLITETADLIRKYDPTLANLWLTQPFQRVGMAIAFANGFLHTGGKLGVDHPVAKIVMKVAFLDKQTRTFNAKTEASPNAHN